MAESLQFDLLLEDRRFQQAIKNASKSTKKLEKDVNKIGSGFSSLKGTLGAIGISNAMSSATSAVRSLNNQLKETIKISADFEVLGVQFEVLTHSVSNATRLIRDLTEFSARTPFQIAGLGDAAKKLLAFGFTQDQVLPKLEQIGNVAAVTSISLSDMARIFGQVSSAGKLTGERLIQLEERSVPIGPALAKTMGIAQEALRSAVEQGLVTSEVFQQAFASISQEGGQAFQGMSKLSQTLTGRLSTLKDNITIVQKSIGDELTPTLKEIVKELTKFIQNLDITEIKKFAREGLSAIIEGFATSLKLIKNLLPGLQLLSDAILTLGQGFLFLSNAVRGIQSLAAYFNGDEEELVRLGKAVDDTRQAIIDLQNIKDNKFDFTNAQTALKELADIFDRQKIVVKVTPEIDDSNVLNIQGQPRKPLFDQKQLEGIAKGVGASVSNLDTAIKGSVPDTKGLADQEKRIAEAAQSIADFNKKAITDKQKADAEFLDKRQRLEASILKSNEDFAYRRAKIEQDIAASKTFNEAKAAKKRLKDLDRQISIESKENSQRLADLNKERSKVRQASKQSVDEQRKGLRDRLNEERVGLEEVKKQEKLRQQESAKALIQSTTVGLATAFGGPIAGAIAGPIFDLLTSDPEQVKAGIEALADQLPIVVDTLADSIPVVAEALADEAPDIAVALGLAMPDVALALAEAIPIVATELADEVAHQVRRFLGLDKGIDTGPSISSPAETAELPEEVLKSLESGITVEIDQKSIDRVNESNGTARANQGIQLATGGFVKGLGNRDTVPAYLSPGELVIDRTTGPRLRKFLDGTNLNQPQASSNVILEGILNKILELLSTPQMVTTQLNIGQQQLADVVLELQRSDARIV